MTTPASLTSPAPTRITFFDWLLPSITAGNKTITIRDASESHYVPGTRVAVHGLESGHYAGDIEILSVTPLAFDAINDTHAAQEYMPLPRLKALIRDIYPTTDTLYLIHFRLI